MNNFKKTRGYPHILCYEMEVAIMPCHRAVVFAKEFIYLHSRGDMTLKKVLDRETAKIFNCKIHSDRHDQ